MILGAEFYNRPTPAVAQELLGCLLSHTTPTGTTSGIIVETEAYLADDPASHSFRGPTPRNQAMFGPPGTAYLYRIYGVHLCFNAVCRPAGTGEAVLIRALEPKKGITLMQERRGKEEVRLLCSGPARLVQALGLTEAENGHPLQETSLSISRGKNWETIRDSDIIVATRIGITQASHLPLRFYLKDNPFVSRR